ncbi:RluA family pseudouridine synthase [Komagataeibacter intermedius]|uniref:Pseudouridine synthase n=2 Tax=Komagataeibacter intermedius TaxID=66229 RepID=A0A0N1N6Y4_9PROT|nr:RluA family pseudouridine synthase [Komagataeibacter intermedius]KPH87527.1 ribosomal large subunit pseudouridine synthase D [Komagataeibacter intermedius AF2]MCF3636246.1 RluA family pseudouridine synthase [Komagataeibacter intermedius]GAN87366.1 ribosomal 23S RNA pseudouridine synthase RluD [Komagataeibacter intermedius TF2]GBQ64218.1 ribosomal RNA large subunit 23S rRNA pseudouridine synthase D [Komagataeibacter intermedius NRIC 0521]
MIDTAPPAPVIATANDAGQRTDRFIANVVDGLSRSRVKSLMESGHLLRDGSPLRDPAEPVRAGMCYEIHIPPAIPATPQGQDIALDILYEDRDLIVLDKPAGMVVHPAPGNEDGTLVNALLAHCGEGLTGIGGERRPGIVHRLDKDTSGIMVAAKTEMAHQALSLAFAERRIDRAYQAICWGIPTPASGSFDGAIGRDRRDRKRMAVIANGGGKMALTHYRVLDTFHGGLAHVECRLATGRTHQIRVHFAHAGHALVGDPVYLRRIPAASRSLPPAAKDAALDFPRQALHARRLGFVHPRSGEQMLFETAPPEDFRHLLSSIA